MTKIVEFERKRFFSHFIWFCPLAFSIHLMEKSNGFSTWVKTVLEGRIDLQFFYINSVIFFAVLLILCSIASQQRATWSTFLLFFWIGRQQFWNFIFHFYTQVQFNAYSPGYFTAILLYFPLYTYLSYLCLRENFLTWRLWLFSFLLSGLAMLFSIWAGLYHFGAIPWDKWLP
jgi:Protein of unknown function with HXXEE motif